MNLSTSTIFLLILSSWNLLAAATNTVTSVSNCYVVGQPFVLSFNLTSPQVGDLMAVLRNGTTAVLLTSPTCKASPCATSGNVSISQSRAVGVYKADLLRSNKATVVAVSTTFRLQHTCGPTTAPSKHPTKHPTKKPTKQPTRKPTKKPTKQPTAAPTASPTAFTVNEAAHSIFTQASDVIAGMVQANSRFTPLFLRLGFHDCVHVCDGCIDLTNLANSGLNVPINALAPVVAQFENPTIGVSRADIWALAVMVGANVADHGTLTQPVNFTQAWFGRVNCEDAGQICRNGVGQPVPCTPTIGPSRNMASPTFNSDTVFSYFAEEFGFTQRQVVAIMGAHTVGHLVKTESGVDGPNGWTFDDVTFQNEYYNALMGAASASTPKTQIIPLSPRWKRAFQNNSGTVFADLNTWSLNVGGKPLVMLDSDISLVRQLDSTNQDSVTGAVTCAFNEATAGSFPVCPLTSTVEIVAQFSDSNDLWMGEFRDTLDLMLTNGYVRNPCSHDTCPLSLVPGINNPAPTSSPTATTPTSTLANQIVTNETNPTFVNQLPTSAPSLVPANHTTLQPSKASSQSTGSPTFLPVLPTKAPVSPATSPFALPVSSTKAPIAVTGSPTPAPVATTTSSVKPMAVSALAATDAPIQPINSSTRAPISSPAPPVSPRNAPTKLLAVPTAAPIMPTGTPTTVPIVLTSAPVLPTSGPSQTSWARTAAPVKPANNTTSAPK